ncbi:hypothetical protein [Roseibium marinum]|uniref:Uncharacterized protein n=1 Tax=Roseibium marinum TaxID=281252 RepID=A0A2S3UJL4_9HYPH|nr:hypothetical protein [Roseibium marinum]POF27922.1 hypothetical protein CLV41_1193 [Roseibium marinum]
MSENKKFSRKELDAAMELAMKKFSRRKNVTGFDVGYRWNGDEPTKELCVRIHVEEKIPVVELEATEVFPSDIDGVPLDVIQGPYRASRSTQATEHRAWLPTLVGGISCGRPDSGTGTLGTIVIHEPSSQPAILSNWHVLAGASARAGDPILQPGANDLSPTPENIVARLTDSILGLDGDAAIAELTGDRPWLPLQFAINHLPEEVRDSRLGETVQKSGRTTGVTKGRVDGEGIYRILYEVRPGVEEPRNIRGFKIVAEKPGNPDNLELSSGGDSGSVWTGSDGKSAVGLHFAGEINPNPSAEHAIACNMTSVTERLNIRLATLDDLLGLSEVQVGRFATTARGRSGLRGELSLPPDWPDGPTGGPTPWPHPWPVPPHGPFPWPPRGPWGPFDPPRDWWRSRALPQFPMRDAPFSAGFQLATPGAVGVRPERAVPGTTVSVTQYIWPRLKRALIARSEVFTGVEPDHEFKDYMAPIAARGFIAAAVRNHHEFQQDGIIAESQDFRNDQVFGQAAVSVGRIYDALGFNVVA